MRLIKNKWVKAFAKTLLPQFILLLSLLGIFALLIWLTRASFYFYGYAAQLSIFVWVVMIVIQWSMFRKRVADIEEMGMKRQFSLEQDRYKSLDDAYESIYEQLEEEFERVKEETRLKEKEQMDYFTLWLHQIKTPISAMSLLLQRQSDDTTNKRQLEQELIYLNDYTHLALTYLKLEETGKELDLEKVQLNKVIKELLKKYSVLFIYRDNTLSYEPIEESVLTDRKWLQVLLEQVLSNSLKYTKEGQITIYMEGAGRLVIEDTGSGIRKEDLPKIFEKGYTGLNGRLHDKSTGLGLFLSRKICKRLNHTLTIESEVGIGTKAIIDFNHTPLSFFD